MKDIIIIDDVSGNIYNMKQAISIYNTENLSQGGSDSLILNDNLSCPIASGNRMAPESKTKWDVFSHIKIGLRNLKSEELILIVDINLDMVVGSSVRNKILQESKEENIPLPSYSQANGEDISKIGIAALMAEVIANIEIKKALIFISSEVLNRSDELYLKDYFSSYIASKNRCKDIYYNFSNPYPMSESLRAQDIIKLALKCFYNNFHLPTYYAIEQLLIAHTIDETKLAHAANSLNKDNLAQGESISDRFIDKGTLFYELIDSGLQISDTCCKALFNCDKSEPIKVEILKQIFIKFGYTIVVNSNFQATQINFPLRNGMIFVAHLLRCLEHIRKHQNNIDILLELEIDSESQSIEKTIFTIELKTFTPHDINRLKNGLDTYPGGSQSGMLIRHLRELMSCSTSIVIDDHDYQKDYLQTYNSKDICRKVHPKRMHSGSYETTTPIFERIIKVELLERPSRLKLSWKPPQ